MSTGSLVRNFAKDNRELRYASSGSIRITDTEHNAYRLALTLEITHIDAPRYGNKKTLPDNTHYGYLTYFKGSTVTDSKAVKFPKFRVFDILNQGMWNYHQSTETTQLLAGTTQATVEASTNFIQSKVSGWLDSVLGISFCSVVQFLDNLPSSWDTQADYSWLLSVAGCDDSEGGKLTLASDYRGFPVASPFPTVIKFKSDIPLSFLWRLEAWYLANPETYLTDSPVDSSDETDDEDEYPDPDQGDGDGDGDEFPESDEPDPDSDSRDFPDSEGGDPGASGVTNIIGYFVAYPNPVGSTETVGYTATVMQVSGRATVGDIVSVCNQSTDSSYAAAGKCFDTTVTCFGQSVNLVVTLESLTFGVAYFENGA